MTRYLVSALSPLLTLGWGASVAADTSSWVALETGYMTMRQGPIAAHIVPTTARVDVRVRVRVSLHAALPVVTTIVDDFSCCAFAVGNAFAGAAYAWERDDVFAQVYGEVIVPTHTTYHLSEQALRLAASIKWADDAERYLPGALSLRFGGRVSWRMSHATLHAAVGVQERFLFDEHVDQTLAEVRVGASWRVSRRVSVRGQISSAISLRATEERMVHAAAVATSIQWTRWGGVVRVYIPLGGALREVGAVGVLVGVSLRL